MTIKRIKVGSRMSQVVVHNGVAYVAGQVARNKPGENATEQTRDILDNIDNLLAEAGTDKSKLLSVTIWLASMDDFGEMNEVWDAWVLEGDPPARACVESKLAAPRFAVEIAVVAAVDP